MKNDSQNIFIIAEAGVNHDGDIKKAKQLIDAAKECGADAVKFQTFEAEALVTGTSSKANYQKKTTSAKEPQLKMLKRLELSQNDFRLLWDYCRKENIMFLSTPFDNDSSDFLDELGMKMFKIPSGEITNLPFLKYLALKKKPLILSTGMADLSEVRIAVNTIVNTGNKDLTLLHCITEYPAPYDEVNLKAMLTLEKTFQLPIGFSDHTLGIEIPLAAAALGAKVIEKHLTLNKKSAGPDHKSSLEPKEFKAMVTGIRHISTALGDGIKRPTASELKNIPVARRSLVALKDFSPGDTIQENDLAIKRPGTGIAPKDLLSVIGRRVKNRIKKDSVLSWGDIQ